MQPEVWSVVITLTVEAATSDEAGDFVRAELLARRGDGERPWQVNGVRRETRRNEPGGPAQ